MADNSTPVAGGDTYRTLARPSGVKTEVVQLDIGGSAGESLASSANPIPVADAVAETALAAISAKTPALGSALVAASAPVTLATDQPPIPTSLPDLVITGAGAQTAAGQNILLATPGTGWLDLLNYKSIGLTVTPGAGTVTGGAVNFEGSNDGVNSTAVYLDDMTTSPLNSLSTYNPTTNTKFYAGPINFRYLRARISSAITGTTNGLQAFLVARNVAYVRSQQIVTQSLGSALVTQSALQAGTNLAADVALNGRATANAASNLRVTTAASTNGTVVKASAGRLYSLHLFNTATSTRFVKFSNSTTITPGTTAVDFVLPIAAGARLDIEWLLGRYFSTGISYCITAAIADTDTTATAANDVVGTLQYA